MNNTANVFMARQPIYNRELELTAYELLFRNSEAASDAHVASEEDAKALVSVLVDIGLSQLIGQGQAFVNISEEMLLSSAVTMLPKERVVLELLETIKATPEVLKRVDELRASGYSFALDDFELTGASEQLLNLVPLVKLDVMALEGRKLRHHAVELKRRGKVLLAEKVETHEMYKLCKIMGFDFFQGYFFAKPELIRGSSIQPNKLALIRLAAKLQSPNVNMTEVEEIISTDVGLSYRLLKLVKTAHFGLPASVSSIKQTLMFLGLSTVSALATLLTMSTSSNKPDELLTTALIRAKMCESLASLRNVSPRESYFTVGLLSVLDALLDAPMEELLEQLPLAKEINSALTGDTGDLGSTLRAAVAYEKGCWHEASLPGIAPAEMATSYTSAVNWACATSQAAMAA